MKRKLVAGGLSAATITLFGGFALPEPAAAQTATNLICNGCVGARDIGTNAVNSRKIRNGTVKPVDLHRRAKPAAVSAASLANLATGGSPLLAASTAVLRPATINAPGPGAVIATGTGILNVAGTVFCKVDSAATPVVVTDLSTAATAGIESVTAHRVFQVSAGAFTGFYTCTNASGVAAIAYNPSLSLVFVPGAQSIATADAPADGNASQLSVEEVFK